MSKNKKVNISSITGRYVTTTVAKKNPKTTVRMTVPVGGKKKK